MPWLHMHTLKEGERLYHFELLEGGRFAEHVRTYGKDSVQYVSMANYSLHKLILKVIAQD